MQGVILNTKKVGFVKVFSIFFQIYPFKHCQNTSLIDFPGNELRLKNRRPKLTMRGFIKRDTVTADIFYFITTEFGCAKCEFRLAAYDGVVLQRFEFIKVCMGKNGNRHYS